MPNRSRAHIMTCAGSASTVQGVGSAAPGGRPLGASLVANSTVQHRALLLRVNFIDSCPAAEHGRIPQHRHTFRRIAQTVRAANWHGHARRSSKIPGGAVDGDCFSEQERQARAAVASAPARRANSARFDRVFLSRPSLIAAQRSPCRLPAASAPVAS